MDVRFSSDLDLILLFNFEEVATYWFEYHFCSMSNTIKMDIVECINCCCIDAENKCIDLLDTKHRFDPTVSLSRSTRVYAYK